MTVLVIDDLRTMKFEANYARTPLDGIVALGYHEKEGLDELWLDHDLGMGLTIIPVVDWLSERVFNGNPYPVELIVVHSANPSGARLVWQTLQRYGYNVERRSAWAYEDYSVG